MEGWNSSDIPLAHRELWAALACGIPKPSNTVFDIPIMAA
jgi:hypothetical protein